jgi:hypothetical protein
VGAAAAPTFRSRGGGTRGSVPAGGGRSRGAAARGRESSLPGTRAAALRALIRSGGAAGAEIDRLAEGLDRGLRIAAWRTRADTDPTGCRRELLDLIASQDAAKPSARLADRLEALAAVAEPAIYGEFTGVFCLEPFKLIEGDLPARAQRLVTEWAERYRSDLLEMWNTQTFRPLPGLE